MINYWEFEGEVIHIYDSIFDSYNVTLRGNDSDRRIVEFPAFISREMLDKFGLVGKYSRMRVQGHFETAVKTGRNGKEKKKLLRICDKIAFLDNTKQPWYKGHSEDFANGLGYGRGGYSE